MLYDLGEHSVETDGDRYFIAPSAAVIGRVQLGSDVSVWFGAVVRGDGNTISIGEGSNVQDTAIVHIDSDASTVIGKNVTVGHAATVHGCTIGDHSLIGIGATILSHAEIGAYCIVGAGAVITERKQFPDRSLIVGVPAKRVREVSEEEMRTLEESARHYVELGKRYRSELKPR